MQKSKFGVSTIILILIFLGIFGGAYFYYNQNYGGDQYYTKITNNGKKMERDSGSVYYHYNLPSYNKDGQKNNIKFNSYDLDRPLKKNAYLKIKYNQHRKEVLSWEKVDANKVPTAAKDKLD
ncbi:YxeA family protein [Lentilactobacillus sp. Marseille-Q4993]|uniref:YxeA family protein n=1 Tax=Lentilactobacillus sp. Marseille-Q4993 TaxID=3039492 RepID=UPI0024BCB1D7|nr:YxeA family protein [Lentilactobacillus sp. Marseille-Q4993]